MVFPFSQIYCHGPIKLVQEHGCDDLEDRCDVGPVGVCVEYSIWFGHPGYGSKVKGSMLGVGKDNSGHVIPKHKESKNQQKHGNTDQSRLYEPYRSFSSRIIGLYLTRVGIDFLGTIAHEVFSDGFEHSLFVIQVVPQNKKLLLSSFPID